MNLTETLAYLRNKVDNITNVVTEDKGHLDHPEDLIFLRGTQGANQAVQAMADTVANPDKVTIKWDGYPALIFGRNSNGKFTILDKHMFNKKDGSGRQVFSPEQFAQYDQARGVNRSDLHQLIAQIWPGLEKSDRSKGYYWGDLLFSKPLVEKNGLYTFKANPNGITYTVDANSELGKFFDGKNSGIVVHQYIAPDALTTDQATPLDGTIGKLKNNSDVAILPAKMPITPKLKINSSLLKKAQATIQKYGEAVEQLMTTAPQARNTFNQLFTTYINKRIVAGDLNELLNGFMEYVNSRPMTDKMREKINQHLTANKAGLVGAFSIWVAIYNLKMDIVNQLNKAAMTAPVKGYLQDGTQTQEGFVSHGLKFVDRMGFSRQNLAGRQ
jgi:hypothetical protein